MSKYVAMLAAMVMTAGSAFATISVNWVSNNGIDDPNTPGAGPDLPVGSLVQLIWSPDAVISSLDPFNPTSPTGNDQLLDSAFTTLLGGFALGGTYPEATVGQTEPTFLSGFVFIRVFNAAAPTIGSWYGESSLVGGPLTDQDPTPGLANTVDIAPGPGAFVLNQQIVPEPSVLALAALGAAVVAVRRFRRS